MNHIELNVGLNVGTLLTHSQADVLAQLPTNWENVQCHLRRSSCNELTACISASAPDSLDVPALRLVLEYLCSKLDQQAIAARHLSNDGYWTSVLEGPQKHLWNGGEFNPDEWLAPVAENRPSPDGEAVLTALIGTEHTVTAPSALNAGRTRRWTVGFQATAGNPCIRGWFENQHNGNGGELLFGWNDGRLELIDYDGVAILPKPVLTFLRTAGIDAGRDFE